jgi:UDP-4-amino-4-deoxy-L-arabinose-oxoglutarate aminotransferase
MITCQDDALAARLRLGRFHGIRKDAWKSHARSGKDLYEVVAPGRKANLPDTLAVLGLHQLRELPANNAERARLAARYHEHLRGIRLVQPLSAALAPGDVHAWHIFVVLVAPGVERSIVVDRLEAVGIGTALHFPAVHTQAHYRARHPDCRLPVSEDVSGRLLSLPLFPGMGDGAVDRVAAALAVIESEVLTHV